MKKLSALIALLLCMALLVACASKPDASTAPADATPAPTNAAPAQTTTAPTFAEPAPPTIQNIIIVIGDGTGNAQLTAGELASGTTFVFRDWYHTHSNTDSLHSDGTEGKLTDSAAGATALATGQLTSNGKVAQPWDSTEPLKTILDYAKEYGKSTGVVTTDTLYGATPSAFSGHAATRDDSLTILTSQTFSNVDLLCSDFDAETVNMKGSFISAGYNYCDFFSYIDKTMSSSKVCWQFDLAGADAPVKLEKVVPHALEYLDQNENGFVLMIEQAHVDKYCHSNEIDGAQKSANSLNNTVAAILEWLGDREDTVIIITADHETGGLSVSPEDIYENRYVSSAGNAFYYQFTSTGHTQTPVPVYIYGIAPDFSQYFLEGETDLIKNTSIFEIMLDVLQNPTKNLP